MSKNKLSNSTKTSIMDKVVVKELEVELKKLDLAKRQYVAFYSCEKRKLITRFAHKLMVSSSHDLASKLERLHKAEQEEEENKKKKFTLPAIVPQPENKFDNYTTDSYSYMDSEQSLAQSPIFELIEEEEEPIKIKKNVMFSNEVIEREIPTKDNLNDYLYNEDEMNQMNQNVIIAKVALVKREKTILPSIVEKKPTQLSTKEFLDSLDNENSGFYICTNSKGKPLCDGYDNYGLLLKSNQKKTEPEPTVTGVFTNPFESITSKSHTPAMKRSPSETSTTLSRSSSTNLRKLSKIDFSNLKNRSKLLHTTNSFNESKTRNNSAYLFRQVLLVKRKEEEEKICSLQLKAQNIRSLTLKPVNIY